MITLLLLFSIIIAILVMIESKQSKYNVYIYLAIGILLICYAGLRQVGFDNDSENYEYTFKHYDQETILKEVSYTFFAWFLNLFTDDVHFLFMIYATLGVSTKFIAFKRIFKDFWFLPIIVYLGNYYILHDMTQIRAGVASGIFLMSLKPLAEGDKKKTAIYYLCALFFHYSSLILFPLLLLNNNDLKKWQKWLLISIVPVSYIMYFAHIEITAIPIPYISDKMDTYMTMRDKGLLGESINVFNATFLLKIFIYYFIIYFYQTIYKFNKYLPLLLKILALSIFSFLFLSPLPVMAFRIMEFYSIVDILLFSSIVYVFKQEWLGKLFVICVGIGYLLLSIYYLEFLHEV